jgi:hypothetical protein
MREADLRAHRVFSGLWGALPQPDPYTVEFRHASGHGQTAAR